jgi:hypothetical protein
MSSSTSTSERAPQPDLRRAGLRLLGALTGVLLLLVLIELGLELLLPSARGLHRDNPSSPAASARFVRNQEYSFAMGWDLRHRVRGRTNVMGFLSPYQFDAVAKPAVALFGDSFTEGEMLAYGESLAGQLEAQSGGAIVPFNFGLSGAALPHYLGMAREMGARFQFDAAVIVVVPGDYLEGFEEKEGLYKWGRPGSELISLVPAAPRSRWKQIARESALVYYLRGNLKFNPSTLFARPGQRACAPRELAAADRERLSRYVEALPRALRLDAGRIVLAVNTNTKDIYERVDRPGAVRDGCPDVDALALAELRKLAAVRGIKVVEIGALLEHHYRAHRRPLDFRPADPHWNGVATTLIAGGIVRELSLAGDAAKGRRALARTD